MKGKRKVVIRRGSGAMENREARPETQPFREQGLGSCGCRSGFGRDDEENSGLQQGALMTIDVAQAALDTVANHGRTNTPRNNGRRTGNGVGGFANPHTQQMTVLMTADRSDQRVLVPRTEPRFARQSEIRRLRPGCGGRNGPRPPSGGDACGLGGGGDSGWRDRLWWPCGHGSRTDACAYAWKVGRCASCLESLKE